MGLFEWMLKIKNRREYKSDPNWVEANAVFTGNREQAVKQCRNHLYVEKYYAYEIIYNTDEGEKHGWYSFHPLPDPEADEIQGETIKIRYKKKKPYLFEPVLDVEDKYE